MKNIFVVTHESIILNNALSDILFRVFFIFSLYYQCVTNSSTNSSTVSNKKSDL